MTRAGAGTLPPSAGEASNDEEDEESEGDSGAGEEVNGEEGLCRVCAEACEGDGDGAGGWECEGEARRGDSVVDMAANAESRESITEGTDGDGEGEGAGDDCAWRGFAGDEREDDEESGMKEEGEDAESEDEVGKGDAEPGVEVFRVDIPGNLIVIFRLRLPTPGEGAGDASVGDGDDRISAGDDPPTTTEIFLDAIGVEGAGVLSSSICTSRRSST